ncbi:MAG: hypothetical protein AB1586_27960 [Pseudomonadota bacterium]
MTRRTGPAVLFAALLGVAAFAASGRAGAEEAGNAAKIDNLKELFARIGSCWRSPELPPGDPGMQITVMVTFKRNGEIFGQPKITYESEYASDDERLSYRTAVMETLQRCSPMPFSDGLGNAVAGRPIRLRFDARRTKSTEKRTWQTTRTL